MNEYIKRADVLETLRKASIGGYITDRLLKIPAADVQSIKHGRWIEVSPKHSRCSVCDTTCLIAVYPISKGANYCPNCGARMDAEPDEPCSLNELNVSLKQ